MRKLLATISVLFILLVGSTLGLRNKDMSATSVLYPVKRIGEWIDLNFLVFEAPAKQIRHLVLADRRVNEYQLLLKAGYEGPRSDNLLRSYETELASSEYMAEQLTLLDNQYRTTIESVYITSLSDYITLEAAGSDALTQRFLAAAQDYNHKAIQVLIQRHRYTPEDQSNYQALIQLRLAYESVKTGLSAEQRQKLEKAEQILEEGTELEYAYDLIAGRSN
ncbi:MAG TPA: DUF5667 domain-containing protein [Patescibacteria group bacterium]|nr:DUF5667 domain-containing protein [Patescibacteria group bacterium]